jgi:hypothetical protein
MTTTNTKSETVDINRIMMAPTLRPAVDVEYTGTLFHVERGSSEYGDYPIVFLNLDKTADDVTSGDVQFHCFHSIARQQFSKLRPAVGSKVSLMYRGQKESKQRKDKDGNPVKYHDYRVWDPTAKVESVMDLWDDDDPGF